MHRIDHPTADITDPAKPKFTEGNPALGTPATILTDDWLNDVQENLLKVIETAGISETKGDDGDLLDAINALIAAAASAGNYAGSEILVANRTVTNADRGMYFHVNANGIVVTLPNPTLVPAGTTFMIGCGSNTGCTVTSPLANGIYNINSNVVTTTLPLGLRSVYRFVVAGGQYHVDQVGGEFSLSANGYQRLPSGLIVQWGTTGTITGYGGSSGTITFPIAFPTTSIYVNFIGDGPATVGNNTNFALSTRNSSGFSFVNAYINNASFRWFAIGY